MLFYRLLRLAKITLSYNTLTQFPPLTLIHFTALLHFCFIKYARQHWVLKMKMPEVFDFAKEMDIPADSF